MTRAPWIVGVSGASGTPYARAVLNGLLDAGEAVDLVVSRAARLTILDETGATVRDRHWKDDVAAWLGRDLGDLVYWPAGDLAAGPSSGSYPAKGMVVVPASTAACAGIAIGLSKDLLQRAAEVNLKERRRTVVVPRETPVTRSHLEHLLALQMRMATAVAHWTHLPDAVPTGNDVCALIEAIAASEAAAVPQTTPRRLLGRRASSEKPS